jgi:seryl-tRNA synthetase
MLDILDFQVDKGGDLKKLKESQRRRFASESAIDDIVVTFEDAKRSRLDTDVQLLNAGC